MSRSPESLLTKEIINYLESINWVVTKTFRGLSKSKIVGAKSGTSDLICCSPTGEYYAFEVKIGKNKPSKEHLEFQHKVRSNNGKAFMLYSLEDLLAVIQE